jgi:transcriptional regulator with XRE-family HTH domain
MPSAARNTNLPGESAFAKYLTEALENAEVHAGFEDSQALNSLVDELVALRKYLGLSQTDVAREMGVKQPTVSGFENEGSDPRISTLQRYARAVDGKIEFRLVSNCEDGFSGRVKSYASAESNVRTHVSTKSTALDLRFCGSDSYADSKRSDFALAS